MSSSCLYSRFTQWGMSDIPDLDQYGEQRSSVVTFEPLAQTWNAKMQLWQAKTNSSENNFIDTFRRTRAGLNLKPISLGRSKNL